jgi:NADP-dependent 3-hydroxy acid dehydrogenase YdfG
MSLNPRFADWRGQVVWLVGASSGIGLATAQLLHAKGARVAVSARQVDAVQAFAATHPGSLALSLDVTDAPALAQAMSQLCAELGPPHLVVYCAGHYQPMRATAFSLAETTRHVQVNQIGALNLLAAVLPKLTELGHGHISLVASVAGYRGLPNALAYGPTKAALINLAEVLYLDLHELGLGVSVVNPGFVATPLTQQNEFTMPALITAEQAAQEMVAGWGRGEFEIHFPKRFTRVLKAMRWLSDGLYFKAIRRATGL